MNEPAMIAGVAGNRTIVRNKIGRIGSIASFIVIMIFVSTSLRGWFVLNLNLPPEIVYSISSLSLILLALYGFYCKYRFKGFYLTRLKNLLIINAIFGIYYSIVNLFLGGQIDVAILYLYLIPYVIFLFMLIPEKKLQSAFYLIFFGIAFSVFDNFIISLNGENGLLYLESYNQKLRPIIFQAMSRTGTYYRVGGYTGSYHDSANILGIFCAYFFTKFIVQRGLVEIIISTIGFSALALTQSAANIVICLFTCFVFGIYIGSKGPKLIAGLTYIVAGIAFFGVAVIFPETLIFIERVGPQGDWTGMNYALGIDLLFAPSFWVGFGRVLEDINYSTEVAFLREILEKGLIPACLLFFIMIFPLYAFIKKNPKSMQSIPYLAAIIYGFLSLLHYGSIFRVTNIAIFYSMYAMFFINIVQDKEKNLEVQNG